MPNRFFIAAIVGVSLLAALATPATGQASSTSGQAPSTYTVRPGDTLYGIARRHGTSMEALAAANGRTVQAVLLSGQVLHLPGTAATATAGAGATPPAPAAAGRSTYTIRPGDTLWGIAVRHRTSIGALTAANGITVSTVLLAGRSLVVPAGSVAAPAPAAPVPASAAPATPTSSGNTRHVVKSGESFSSIAARYGTTPRSLAASNNLTTSAVIVPGQALVVPAVPLPPGTPAGLPLDLIRRADALALVPVFRSAASEWGVPADLLMSLSYRESGWRTDARSATGAIGIGQLLPATAHWVATTLMKDPSLDPAVAAHNVRMSARLLRWMLDRFGWDTRLALAAYFDGPGAVSRTGVSPIAESYAASITSRRGWFV